MLPFLRQVRRSKKGPWPVRLAKGTVQALLSPEEVASWASEPLLYF